MCLGTVLGFSRSKAIILICFSPVFEQGKSAEGIVHLERVAQLEEPDEPSSKTHYFEGLLLLSR